ncbi:MAG: hypothetical protein JWN72_1826 [Thermoleophilia bacterium]|nr:hypothetical protein [Thermoleophilia bacterium]
MMPRSSPQPEPQPDPHTLADAATPDASAPSDATHQPEEPVTPDPFSWLDATRPKARAARPARPAHLPNPQSLPSSAPRPRPVRRGGQR